MPDPLLYLQAVVVVASASALAVLALGWRSTSPSQMLVSSICVAGLVIGQVAGCVWLRFPVSWPPASALDRYWVVLLPAAIVVELFAAFPKFPPWGAHALRLVLAASMARVLLHRSVYFDEWTAWQAPLVLAVCAALSVGVWVLLARLAERSPGVSLPLALALTIQGAGVAIMLAGYLRGGAAAMVAAAALLGASLACALVAKQVPQRALVGFSVVSLCSLLFIGVFFGRLPMASAMALLAAPLLCWLTELDWCCQRSASALGTIRLTIVATVVAIVLLIAHRKFELEFRPLLLDAAHTSTRSLCFTTCPVTPDFLLPLNERTTLRKEAVGRLGHVRQAVDARPGALGPDEICRSGMAADGGLRANEQVRCLNSFPGQS